MRMASGGDGHFLGLGQVTRLSENKELSVLGDKARCNIAKLFLFLPLMIRYLKEGFEGEASLVTQR